MSDVSKPRFQARLVLSYPLGTRRSNRLPLERYAPVSNEQAPSVERLAPLRLGLSALFAKESFTASPAVEQAVMAQAQGGDPSQGAGGPQGAPPPDAGGGAPPMPPPGQDPGMAQAAPPPPDAQSPGGDPLSMKVDQLTQMVQQLVQGGGAGGAGPNGKPNTASVKFEPQHFHQVTHDISVMKTILHQMADALGLQVPASSLLSVPAPGQQAPGAPGGAPGGAQVAQGAAPPAGGPDQGGGPPASQIAQQLPNLPPVASKAAGALGKLAAGTPVDRNDGVPDGSTARLAALAFSRTKGAA